MPPVIFEPTIFLVSRSRKDKGRTLRHDIGRIIIGTGPSDMDLLGAPLLDNWCALLVDGHCCLSGRVEGHPIRRDGLVVTSQLCAIDSPHFVWARTAGRFYRLGPTYWNSFMEKIA
jgi:hypothetical protein